MYVGELISLMREKTGNTSYSTDASGNTLEGISDKLILSFLNDGLAYLQSRIIAQYPGAFVYQNIQSIVANQENYTIDDNVFLNNKIVSVEYSPTGNLKDYYLLPPAGLQQRDTSPGLPYQYIRRNGQILINRIPSSAGGTIRINYYRTIDRFALRVGTVVSTTGLDEIVVAAGDELALDASEFLCTVDRFGEVKDYNLEFVSYEAGTGTIEVAPVTAFECVADDYVVVGKYSSTHLPSDAPIRMLDYCKFYAQMRIYNTDSSIDEMNERTEVKDCLGDIMDAFSELTVDVQDIPIIDGALS